MCWWSHIKDTFHIKKRIYKFHQDLFLKNCSLILKNPVGTFNLALPRAAAAHSTTPPPISFFFFCPRLLSNFNMCCVLPQSLPPSLPTPTATLPLPPPPVFPYQLLLLTLSSVSPGTSHTRLCIPARQKKKLNGKDSRRPWAMLLRSVLRQYSRDNFFLPFCFRNTF